MSDAASAESSEPCRDFLGFEAIPMSIVVLAGRGRGRLDALTHLAEGDVIPLDRVVGEPFELRSGGRLLGFVEVVTEEDGIAIKLLGVAGGEDG